MVDGADLQSIRPALPFFVFPGLLLNSRIIKIRPK